MTGSAESDFDRHDKASRESELVWARELVLGSKHAVDQLREAFDTLGDRYYQILCDELLERIKKMNGEN